MAKKQQKPMAIASHVGTGVSTAKQFTQDNIPAMLEEVNAKIEALTGDSWELF